MTLALTASAAFRIMSVQPFLLSALAPGFGKGEGSDFFGVGAAVGAGSAAELFDVGAAAIPSLRPAIALLFDNGAAPVGPGISWAPCWGLFGIAGAIDGAGGEGSPREPALDLGVTRG